ncbi:transposase [Geothrix sp. PMB-07]|uniref:transposase n=1 Tax=Geothrix sp. PMB-07 TaxID=3068640 RepID=UPI00355843B8
MPRKGHSEEQIVFALKQAENGAKIPDICRKLGISDQTFYRWKHQFEGLGVSELRELRQLRDENARLKRLVADLSLDKHILQEVLSKKSEGRGATFAGGLDPKGLWVQ